MNRLFIDTATKYLCIGIAKDEKVIYKFQQEAIKKQSGSQKANGPNRADTAPHFPASSAPAPFCFLSFFHTYPR